MSFIYQQSFEEPRLLFLNMLRVCVVVQLPWGSGTHYKSVPSSQLLYPLLVPSSAL